MSVPVDPSSREALHDEAVAWLIRVQSDAATVDDWTALTAWLEASEAHQAAFHEVELLSQEIDESRSGIGANLRPNTAEVVALRPRPALQRRWFAFAGAAAAAAVAGVAAPALMRSYQGEPMTYETGIGEVRNVALADGTRIRLDAGSKMTVRLGWRRRQVELAEAETAFDVAKDPKRPFVITVGDQEVRVVGTEFNVRHYDATVSVTVRRGVVEVRQPALGSAPVARLTVGDQLNHREGTQASIRRKVDPATAFAWTEGRLVCEDEALGQIVADLNRRYTIPIRVSPAVASRRFSGVLELGDQDQLVRRLAGYLSLRVHRTAREITLS